MKLKCVFCTNKSYNQGLQARFLTVFWDLLAQADLLARGKVKGPSSGPFMRARHQGPYVSSKSPLTAPRPKLEVCREKRKIKISSPSHQFALLANGKSFSVTKSKQNKSQLPDLLVPELSVPGALTPHTLTVSSDDQAMGWLGGWWRLLNVWDISRCNIIIFNSWQLKTYSHSSTLWCQIVHMGGIKTSWVTFVKPQRG